jgi:hypothetical protein
VTLRDIQGGRALEIGSQPLERQPRVLWLDDVRKPEGWLANVYWARSYGHCLAALQLEPFTIASLDHDLGSKKTGLDVVKWMVEHNVWPTDRVVVHSWNVPGSQRMCELIDRFGPYEKKCRHIPAIGAP